MIFPHSFAALLHKDYSSPLRIQAMLIPIILHLPIFTGVRGAFVHTFHVLLFLHLFPELLRKDSSSLISYFIHPFLQRSRTYTLSSMMYLLRCTVVNIGEFSWQGRFIHKLIVWIILKQQVWTVLVSGFLLISHFLLLGLHGLDEPFLETLQKYV